MSSREFGEDALSFNRCRFATRLPTNRIYTRSHYWLREVEPGLWRVGLTAYGTRLLGEIVEYEFKVQPGTAVDVGQTIGWVEGFKTLSDLCSVAAGEFVAENAALRGDITLLDSDPYEQGWLYQVRGHPEPSAVNARAYTEVLNAALDAMLGGRELDDVDE